MCCTFLEFCDKHTYKYDAGILLGWELNPHSKIIRCLIGSTDLLDLLSCLSQLKERYRIGKKQKS